MTYLSSPYSHKDPRVVRQRFEDVCRLTARLLRDGIEVYSPITYTHPLATIGGLHLAHDEWLRFDTRMMDRCTELWIAMLDGWGDSLGIAWEADYMRSHDKTVRKIDPVTLDIDPQPMSLPRLRK